MFFSRPSYLQSVGCTFSPPTSVLLPSLGCPINILSSMWGYVNVAVQRHCWQWIHRRKLTRTDNNTRKFAETGGEVSEKIGQRRIWECFQNISWGTSIKFPDIFTETHSRNFGKKKSPKEIFWKFEIICLHAPGKTSRKFAVSHQRILERIRPRRIKKDLNTIRWDAYYKILRKFEEIHTRKLRKISLRHTREFQRTFT